MATKFNSWKEVEHFNKIAKILGVEFLEAQGLYKLFRANPVLENYEQMLSEIKQAESQHDKEAV